MTFLSKLYIITTESYLEFQVSSSFKAGAWKLLTFLTF